MKNDKDLRSKLNKLNNSFKVSEILHEISLMTIPEHLALKVYELSKEFKQLNY